MEKRCGRRAMGTFIKTCVKLDCPINSSMCFKYIFYISFYLTGQVAPIPMCDVTNE